MRGENVPWRPVTAADLHWTPQGDPVSAGFEDVYYSRDNGLEESRHVFLAGNDLPRRWGNRPGAGFCIAETGFGTGLNFLLTWQTWREQRPPRPRLHYLAIEKFPLRRDDLSRALEAWPALAAPAQALLERYPGLLPGEHRLLLDGGRVVLDLWWSDVGDALSDLAGLNRQLVDAWYLDGFAPARNGRMWEPGVLHAAAALSRPGASFATFTAAGQVRRDLAAAGFAVEKVPGYGRKRECLRGRLARSPVARVATSTPWDVDARPLPAPQRALVIGAGLAGCSTAAALARRGLEVTLLEQAQLAGAASGNTQGVLYTRLSTRHSAVADFALLSYRFAVDFYRDLFRAGRLSEGADGALCGSFHQGADPVELAELSALLAPVQEFAQVLEPAAASVRLGVEQLSAGYWHPGSGWLHPPAVCRALAAEPGIRLLENCGPLRLEQGAEGWVARAGSAPVASAPCAVIAGGTGSALPAGLDWLPLRAVRGQTTDLPAGAATAGLRAVLCHDGYIAPARAGWHCIGASFQVGDTDAAPREEDHRQNLARLAAAVPAWRELLQAVEIAALQGRAGFRCTSPDYLPLAGPVPDRAAFLREFASLRKNARRVIAAEGCYLPGLYLTTAHGSRGLTATPLAAELLASRICGEPPPVHRDLTRALAPARFLVRDLVRNRI